LEAQNQKGEEYYERKKRRKKVCIALYMILGFLL
jgi:hypothetical protein